MEMGERELFQRISAVARRIEVDFRSYDESRDPRFLDSLVFQTDLLYRLLLRTNADNSVLTSLGQCGNLLISMQESPLALDDGRNNLPSVQTGRRGRPAFMISREQLEHLY